MTTVRLIKGWEIRRIRDSGQALRQRTSLHLSLKNQEHGCKFDPFGISATGSAYW